MSRIRTTLALALAAVVLLCAAAWRAPGRPRRGAAGEEPCPERAAGATVHSPTATDAARVDSPVGGRGRSKRRANAPRLPEPSRPAPRADEASRAPAQVGSPAVVAGSGAAPTARAATECLGTGEVLLGPATFPTSPGGIGLATTDPARRALEKLGVDLERPEESLRRLADEYRASFGSAEADGARMAQVDQGMAAIVRTRPEAADTLFTLFVQERHRGMGRYLAYLLRDARRADQEPALLLMAAADPDEARRANALVALAPARSDATVEALIAALSDPSAAVRLASVDALEASLAERPALRATHDVERLIAQAREDGPLEPR